jgi:hypothetical protein
VSLDKLLFFLVFIYYAFIVGLLIFMFLHRKKAVTTGQIRMGYFKTYSNGGTDYLVVLQNHFNNQFQVPILFFITCIVAKLFHTISEFTIVLASLFIMSRWFHSYIHLTSNHLIKRASSYFVGLVIMILMWLEILLRA